MKKVLVVVDMQNDFITGPLGNKECKKIVSNVVRKVNEAIANGIDVIFTQDTHDETYLKTQEGKNLPVEHCIRFTDGWKIIPELAEYANTCIYKPTFGSTYLSNKCVDQKYKEIELIGVCTGICVISNAMLLKAACPETKITVDASCCACVTPESHKTALEAMKMCQINITNE